MGLLIRPIAISVTRVIVALIRAASANRRALRRRLKRIAATDIRSTTGVGRGRWRPL